MTSATDAQEEPESVLLVDDNATNLQVLYQTLDGSGYRLLTARSGEQALSIAARIHPAMILLDIMMPGLDGFETCRRLKSDPETAESAVIFLSALGEAKDKVKGLELGAVDYIAKPFDPEEVIARVDTHLKIRRLERSLVRKNRELEEANQRMRLDLEAAARVQQSFLPEGPPDSNGADIVWKYRPCEELAGDYLNVWAFDDRHIGMYILDVSGHGVRSSLLAVSVARSLSTAGGSTSLLTEPSDDPAGYAIVSPAKVAKRLNTLYPMDFRARLYFTFLYGILDTESRHLRFVSAGNRGPALVRSGGSVEFHDVPAVPIGLFPESEYEDSLLELHPGDRMYLYTDGLSEERNPAREEFGKHRMNALLSESRGMNLGESVDALISGVVDWRGNEHLRDDVAILATEIRSS